MRLAKRIKQRPQAGILGKHLTRRSRGKCELCESRDQPRPFELSPFPEEPDLDRTLMACQRCRCWLEVGKINPIEAHFLEGAVWAELPPVRLAAARMLLSYNDFDDPWMRDALDATNVDPTTLEFRDNEWN
jgi:hypothetical protein